MHVFKREKRKSKKNFNICTGSVCMYILLYIYTPLLFFLSFPLICIKSLLNITREWYSTRVIYRDPTICLYYRYLFDAFSLLLLMWGWHFWNYDEVFKLWRKLFFSEWLNYCDLEKMFIVFIIEYSRNKFYEKKRFKLVKSG